MTNGEDTGGEPTCSQLGPFGDNLLDKFNGGRSRSRQPLLNERGRQVCLVSRQKVAIIAAGTGDSC